MEFLVQIEIRLPVDMEPARRDGLIAAERERALELAEAGTLRRIWRIPGTTDNAGIWAAADATELHQALTSLPLHPWMRVRVTALALHPVEAARPPGPASPRPEDS